MSRTSTPFSSFKIEIPLFKPLIMLSLNLPSIFIASILLFIIPAASQQSIGLTGFPPVRPSFLSIYLINTHLPKCDALITAGLSNRLLHPTNPAYEPRIQSYWALNTRRRPYCIFQPRSTSEVSTGLSALLDSDLSGAGDWHVAVRAGGHNLGYSNNLENGVTIDLKYLSQVQYNPAKRTASLGPSAKWQDVYAQLHEYGVTAAGGRDGDVGVGGFLLGGGSTYYMGLTGFACDMVQEIEVVLANGSIVLANSQSNAELWKALKGGGSNYGIVTRFEVDVLPDRQIARGERTISAENIGGFVDAVVDFTESQERYKDDALVAMLVHAGKDVDILATIEVNVNGTENSSAFSNFSQISQIAPFNQSVQFMYEAALDSRLEGGQWYVLSTIGYANL